MVPRLQYIVISIFTSDTGDSVLMGHCRHLLLILAVLLLFDMAQNGGHKGHVGGWGVGCY